MVTVKYRKPGEASWASVEFATRVGALNWRNFMRRQGYYAEAI